ncbi:MAG TPA: hypothetical protein VHF26_14335 [Trebonia sp.]|nr:hypothetical protein [Trebonia sp.]
MMYGWSAEPSLWEWAWMFLGPLVLAALAGAAAVAGIRSLRHGAGPEPEARPRRGADELLADRFARGEIGEDEYRQRLRALRSAEKD